MIWILLAEQEAATLKRMKSVLASHGWFLKTVVSQEQALEEALEEPPQLVIVDELTEGADDLVRTFAGASGGPGVILVGDDSSRLATGSELSIADAFLPRTFDSTQLLQVVRERLEPSEAEYRTSGAGPHGRMFTTQEIFGDLLDEIVDTQPTLEPPAPSRHSARRSSQTPKTSTGAAATPGSRETPDIDRKVDDTLADPFADTHPGLHTHSKLSGKLDNGEIDSLLQEVMADLGMSLPESAGTDAQSPRPAPPPAAQPSDSAPSHLPPLTASTVSNTAPPPVAPELRIGEYILEERTGSGGMAEVWKARRQGVEGFEKRVAIKRILPGPADNPAFIKMFVDEAKLAAQLNHQHITHIYELGKSDSDYFIAMEYVEGGDLGRILDAGRKLDQVMPARLALLIGAKIATALDYAHRQKGLNQEVLGLVHRDVSPRNVLISYEGDVKLCDFGVAKAASKVATTQKGALKGKLPYMSPEQAWGKSVDSRSDIFSAGVLLFEMLTGRRLFDADSELALLEAVRQCEIGPLLDESPEIPPSVRPLLAKALACEPSERIQSAGELQAKLEEFLQSLDPPPNELELSSHVRELLGDGMPAEDTSSPESPAELPRLAQLTIPVGSEEGAEIVPPPSLEEDANLLERDGHLVRMRQLLAAFVAVAALSLTAWWGWQVLEERAAMKDMLEAPQPAGRTRPGSEAAGASHATQSGADAPDLTGSSSPSETDESAREILPSSGADVTPALRSPTVPFEGDHNLQRQFETEMQRVEELLAASPYQEPAADDSEPETTADDEVAADDAEPNLQEPPE